MSHFVVLAVLPKDPEFPGAGDHGGDTPIERLLSWMFDPYSEQDELPEYTKKCWCVGRKTEYAAAELVKFGDRMEAFRGHFNSQSHVKAFHELEWKRGELSKEEKSTIKNTRKTIDREWGELIAPLIAEEKAAIEAHPMKDKPDPECDECHGAGIAVSTYNPQSKWDWWTIGGRWTGWLSGYDPEKDPENIVVCELCAGTGKRDDRLGREQRAKDPTFTCNGCDGKGKHVSWPTRWKHHTGDVSSVDVVLESFQTDEPKIPFAILTPEREWIERGSMGWWGMVRDEEDEEVWARTVKTVMEKYKGHVAVVVDCHI